MAGVESFKYPASPRAAPPPAWEGFTYPDPGGGLAPGTADTHLEPKSAASLESEARLAEEKRKAFEAGRAQGKLEGQQAQREQQSAAQTAIEAQRARQLAELVQRFADEGERYLKSLEHEVVKLALAVAARILRREAQMDPLLLTGAVRVALGQLAGTTEMRLRVPKTDFSLWSEAMALLPNLSVKPTVIQVEGMRLGDCEIETAVGTVDLGVRAQLAEIERGFFDQAPAARPLPVEGLQNLAGSEV
jgi:flagellar assembly protein FliH